MPILALYDLGSKVNAIHLTFAQELRLFIKPIDVRAQKIDGIMLDNFEMVVIVFLVIDKLNQARFFEKTFLVANISSKVVFGILFLTLTDADVDFLDWELWWRIYTTKKALPTTKHVKIMGKKEFVARALDLEYEIYIVHIRSVSFIVSLSFSPLEFNVHISHRPQISGLITKEAVTKVSDKYINLVDVFSPDLASELPKYTEINDHAIELVNCQQPPYKPIYSLGLVEMETLKAYIEINLANRFIRSSKSPADSLILFDWKSDSFFWLCVNYHGLNNLRIKN